MGTPDFAVPSLDILVQHGYTIAGVVTAPDKPAGRGQQLQYSAVKKYALEKELKILQPEKLKNENFLAELRALDADLFIVVAFRMLPEVVWQMPEYGTFNLHASLLPQYRGAAPINHAIINDEKESGVTTFFLQQEIDTGNIIFQEKTVIEEEDNAGTLHDKLSRLGAQVVLKTVKSIEEGKVISTSQASIIHSSLSILKTAPKIFKEDCRINWDKKAGEVHNLIRGLSPYPGAFTELNGKMLKIYRSKISSQLSGKEPKNALNGELSTDHKTYLRFRCQDGWLDILDLQLEGKKRMDIQSFLRGYSI